MIEGNPEWVTRADAAKHLGKTIRTINTYVSKGILPAYKIHGRRTIIDLRDCEKLRREMETPQPIKISA